MARSLPVAAGLLLLAGCNAYYNAWSPDDFMKSIPWFDHMITSRAVHPYSRADIPRTTVPGTVPITRGGAGGFGVQVRKPGERRPADQSRIAGAHAGPGRHPLSHLLRALPRQCR